MKSEKQASYNSLVIIPALNPAPELVDYVHQLLTSGIPGVIVVNDGSREDCLPVFEKLQAMEGCTVLTHPQNRGKGCALKTAYAYVLETPALADYDGVVTADADGQHHVKDVCNLAAALKKDEKQLILGVRDLGQENVPTRSKIGNRLTSFGFYLLYGARLGDTQTGLRATPRTLLQWSIDIQGDRFEYEMNVLIGAVRDHIGYREIPIRTIYFDNNSGSHLHAVKDSWRIFVILMSGLGRYTGAAAASAVLDVLVFWLSYRFLFSQLPTATCYLAAVVLARVMSSVLNFVLNRCYVFNGKHSIRILMRYYSLWGAQLLCSYLLLMFFESFIPWPALLIKIIVDGILAILSYQVQLRWVFAHESEER
ncbi:MAG: bifunctional glycosyltransferase family 2/GtrA family protein [Clostridia bacterium]|nr:bifunctional glycosyltransferase family 2/GtrA family protein [Clostridia bacterium]